MKMSYTETTTDCSKINRNQRNTLDGEKSELVVVNKVTVRP
jgi:hypothetical protein